MSIPPIIVILLVLLALTSVTVFLIVSFYAIGKKKVFWGFMEGAAFHFVRGSKDGSIAKIFYQEDYEGLQNERFLRRIGLRTIGLWPFQQLVDDLKIAIPEKIGRGAEIKCKTVTDDHLLKFSPIVVDFEQIDVQGYEVTMSVTVELEVPDVEAANQHIVVKRGKGYLLALQAIRQAADRHASSTSIDQWSSSTGRTIVDRALKTQFQPSDGVDSNENLNLLEQFGCKVKIIMVTDHKTSDNTQELLQRQEKAKLEGDAKIIEAKKAAEAARKKADGDLYVAKKRAEGKKVLLDKAGVPVNERGRVLSTELVSDAIAKHDGTLVIGANSGLALNE